MKLASHKARCNFSEIDLHQLLLFKSLFSKKALTKFSKGKNKHDNLQEIRNKFVELFPNNAFSLGGMAFSFGYIITHNKFMLK